jgi:hypothetical protein
MHKGDIKGSTATIASSGGSFTAGTVSADSSIKTVGGRVSIKQLVGISLDINTGGGEIVLGSLYGNGLKTMRPMLLSTGLCTCNRLPPAT